MVKLDRAYVNMKLLPVIFSLGKKLTVQDVAVEGLAVQVARLPDGRLNLQDIADKLPRSEDKPPRPRARPQSAGRGHAGRNPGRQDRAAAADRRPGALR